LAEPEDVLILAHTCIFLNVGTNLSLNVLIKVVLYKRRVYFKKKSLHSSPSLFQALGLWGKSEKAGERGKEQATLPLARKTKGTGNKFIFRPITTRHHESLFRHDNTSQTRKDFPVISP